MARHFLDNIDLNQGQILNVRAQILASDPSTGSLVEGQFWYNSSSGILKYFDGTNIHALGTTTGVNAETLNGYSGSFYLSRANHTGTQTASTISDFDTEVSNNTSVAANTAARHSALTLGASTNGLSLSGQTLQLSLATSSLPGAMSASDKSAIDELVSTYAPISHTHSLSEITDSGTAAGYDIGTSNGTVPVLGADGKLSPTLLPSVAVTSTFVVSSEAEMLALTAQEGDVAVRTDVSKSFILTTNAPTNVADWQELLTPTDLVQSVNGQTGSVTLTTSEITEGSNLYWTNGRFDTRIGVTPLSDLAAADSNISLGGFKITSLGTPTLTGDAATKGYIDGEISGLASTYMSLTGGNTVSGDQNVTGSVTATSFSGDGGSLTNVDAVTLGGQSGTAFAAASHTHTASEVTDFDTQVRTSSLDQMSAPTAPVSMNGQRLSSLAAPSASSDAATRQYVDDAVSNVGTAFAGYVPSGSTTPTIQHNLGTSDITFSVYRQSDGVEVEVGAKRTDGAGTLSDNHLTLSFTTAPSSNQYRVVIVAA